MLREQKWSGEAPPDLDAPRRQPAVGTLTLVQFFVGGVVLFVASGVLMMFAPTASQYDGIMSILSVGITAVIIALSSMIPAMVIGLPIRLVPALQSRWLAHGELTVAGAGLGLVLCVAAMSASSVERGARPGSDDLVWMLIIGWALFSISVAHFVWPARWTRNSHE